MKRGIKNQFSEKSSRHSPIHRPNQNRKRKMPAYLCTSANPWSNGMTCLSKASLSATAPNAGMNQESKLCQNQKVFYNKVWKWFSGKLTLCECQSLHSCQRPGWDPRALQYPKASSTPRHRYIAHFSVSAHRYQPGIPGPQKAPVLSSTRPEADKSFAHKGTPLQPFVTHPEQMDSWPRPAFC